jgi:hypothetical protein
MFTTMSLMPSQASAMSLPSSGLIANSVRGIQAEPVGCWTKCGYYGCRRVCSYGYRPYYRPYYRPRYYRYY